MASGSTVGLSDPELSGDRRRLFDLMNKLHSTGVQIDLDLPQIAVIGSQSAGKSSLIESISGITLPRSTGTCTRCPTECLLRQSEEAWRCSVELRLTIDKHGRPLGQAHDQPFGEVITDKREVEERIRRAQKAILNPDTPYETFLTGKEADFPRESQLSFSKNSVCLEISGPDIEDLSFCDLPGLIASGRPADIALINDLVTSYIEKPSCIVLLTVACETDFENQGAHHLAKKYDPAGKRTVGVLTKPDRIPTGEENEWLPFIRNEKEVLLNNWFCVKQPSSDDLKTTKGNWAQARTEEEKFFAKTAPWSGLEPFHQRRLGTAHLVQRLSEILLKLIRKRLPSIRKELRRTINATQKMLDVLPPPPPDNPQVEVNKLLHEFISDLKMHVTGVPDEDGLMQSIRPAQERFRRAIRATAPNFRPFHRRDEAKRHIRRAEFLVQEEGDVPEEEHSEGETEEDEDEEEEDKEDKPAISAADQSDVDASNDTDEDDDEVDEDDDEDEDEEPSTASDNPQQTQSQSTARDEDDDMTPETDTPRGSPEPVQAQIVSRGQKRKSPCDNRIYIDEVMDRANRARTRELPGTYPFVVQKTFIEIYLNQWEGPALVLCKTVRQSVFSLLEKLVKKHFGAFGTGALMLGVRRIMRERLAECASQAERQLKWQTNIEKNPFSLNTHYLNSYFTKFMAYYNGERQRYNNSALASAVAAVHQHKAPREDGTELQGEHTPSHQELLTILAGLSKIGMSGLKAEDLLLLLPRDDMDPALNIMSLVRAYFQVAYKRFADNVPLAIDYELVCGVERDLTKVLNAGLRIDGEKGYQKCAALAQESQETADSRAELMKKLQRLRSADHELTSVRES